MLNHDVIPRGRHSPSDCKNVQSLSRPQLNEVGAFSPLFTRFGTVGLLSFQPHQKEAEGILSIVALSERNGKFPSIALSAFRHILDSGLSKNNSFLHWCADFDIRYKHSLLIFVVYGILITKSSAFLTASSID
jgi:hypothetical protein